MKTEMGIAQRIVQVCLLEVRGRWGRMPVGRRMWVPESQLYHKDDPKIPRNHSAKIGTEWYFQTILDGSQKVWVKGTVIGVNVANVDLENKALSRRCFAIPLRDLTPCTEATVQESLRNGAGGFAYACHQALKDWMQALLLAEASDEDCTAWIKSTFPNMVPFNAEQIFFRSASEAMQRLFNWGRPLTMEETFDLLERFPEYPDSP